MQGWLYPDTGGGLLALILLTGLGFLASLATGRSFATSWSPLWLIIPAMIALAAGVHFLHYALFEEQLSNAYYYAVTLVILLIGAALGYRSKRAAQMGTQYRWMFLAEGMFWKERPEHLA
jgi:hypothetical protein